MKGTHELLVESWLDHRFFSLKWPKSLDRRTFHHCLTDSNFLRLDAPDALATLASFTAKSISLAIDALPKKPRYLFVSGGGCHNRMLTSLVELYTGIPLQLGSGWSNKLPTDMLEAELIAFLAARYLSGLPSSFPETTGCKHPVCVGRLMISEDSE